MQNRLGLNEDFQKHLGELQDNFELLLKAEPRQRGTRWPMGLISGVYLFSEGHNHIYVGRSRNIKNRYSAHTANSHYSASFAFILAREETGFTSVDYTTNNTRAKLLENERFRLAFDDARKRIKNMQFRYVKEPDPIKQCLLEVYCSVALKTPYNKFETH